MQTKMKVVLAVIGLLTVIVAGLGFVYKLKLAEEVKEKVEIVEDDLRTEEVFTAEDEILLQEQVGEIIKTKDFSKCQEVESEFFRTVCDNNMALNMAKETRDASYCRMLDDKLLLISDCERMTVPSSAIENDDVSLCEILSDNRDKEECQYSFYQKKSIAEKNKEVCGELNDEKSKKLCEDEHVYSVDFVANTDKFDCSLFSTDEAKSDCNSFNAVPEIDEMQSDPAMAMCSKFNSLAFLKACLQNIN